MMRVKTESIAVATAGAALLQVEGLTITFQTSAGPTKVVDDVSFNISAGETLGVVGESGSGKSMTSLAIMGLLPESASVKGSIKLNGYELVGLSDRTMRSVRGFQIAMIFQDPLSSLNPYLTVGSQIAEAYLAHHHGTSQDARTVAIEAMKRVSIIDPERRFDHYPHQFSGGMRQRIMIAMALSCSPDLIIADEPTTALDVTVQAQILTLLKDIQRETGAGMLFITHDLAVVSEVADVVTVMRAGVQEESGSTEQVFTDPKSDYTQRLLDSTPRIDEVLDPSSASSPGQSASDFRRDR